MTRMQYPFHHNISHCHHTIIWHQMDNRWVSHRTVLPDMAINRHLALDKFPEEYVRTILRINIIPIHHISSTDHRHRRIICPSILRHTVGQFQDKRHKLQHQWDNRSHRGEMRERNMVSNYRKVMKGFELIADTF